jgi:hypothetical protein
MVSSHLGGVPEHPKRQLVSGRNAREDEGVVVLFNLHDHRAEMADNLDKRIADGVRRGNEGWCNSGLTQRKLQRNDSTEQPTNFA